jgi:NADPH:quinone reductase-like Zn-dependent oxidoreductase/acyl carrier protein/short-subunit dehydrogenase
LSPGEGELLLTGVSPEDVTRLVADAVAVMGGCDHVVHMLGLLPAGDDPMPPQDLRCVTTLHLTQALEGAGLPAQPKLWLVTQGGAVMTDAGDGALRAFRNEPAQAALWGFGRVLMNEHPDLDCTLVDVQTSLDAPAVERVYEELTAPDGEDEIILTQAGRYATRMSPFPMPAPREEHTTAHARLDFIVPGQLRNLHWRALPERVLQADEIEIQPKAVGLNFRDVMYAMGLLSDEAVENGFAGATLGMELAGVVTRAGADVDEFQVGDAVVAFAPACFANRVVTKAGSAARKPEAWTFEEAATVPTVFFTVYYALHYLARLQPDEKILIHGAAGGVGIAAIQVARYLGAEIFATAGSDEKRDFVTLLGADHIMNSRTLAYADEIMAITGGAGIDVVLNSLAGEAINRNFRVLRPFGRFLELGKRDFYENTKIGLRPFKDNITYYGIDADQLMVERPALATSLFREVMALFGEGVLRPLPYRAFPASRVVDAFRYMQQSRQIGKVVVTFDDAPLPVVAPERAPEPLALSRDATYIVTGGIGGFGQRTARWLAEQGAGHLVLLSRRGADAPGAAETREELEALGARVYLRACDVTDADQVINLINEIKTGMPVLKGIVHAAMVLEDGLIRNLDQERLLRAMAPKIQGGWNLHRATLGLPLDFFVFYSSATTFIGNPGQANYVAANMYLESLAAFRRGQGLSATCVAWGAISDVGYLARNEDIKDALQSRLGGHALSSALALRRLGAMMQADVSGVAAIDFEWHTLHRFLPATRAPRFDELRRMAGQGGGDAGSGEDIREILAGSTPEEAQGIIRDLLLEEVAAILRLPMERIDTERSLYDLGMDSLMGVELVLGIEKRFGISLPVMALTEGPTIKRISERLVMALLPSDGGALAQDKPQDHLADMVSGVAAQHGVEASAEDVAQAVQNLRAQTGAGAGP